MALCAFLVVVCRTLVFLSLSFIVLTIWFRLVNMLRQASPWLLLAVFIMACVIIIVRICILSFLRVLLLLVRPLIIMAYTVLLISWIFRKWLSVMMSAMSILQRHFVGV